MEKILRDKMGNKIAILKKLMDGNMAIYDRYGTFRGTYVVKRDVTLDKLGNRVGYGNLLVTLINVQ
ncbi:hypothetical protein WOC76_09320 [Methylocystis sp. IM3]|uniref:hypothetical protein n=1 Tax=unclassified Methylocystis TaxID=2625913 RepID=UPI0030F5E1C2